MDKRTANFTTAEENNLLTIVRKFKNIVECKKTDSLSNNEKKTIWITIAKEYNASATTTRSADALKTKYKNIKKRSKQKFADERANVKGTGGGPAKVIEINSADLQVLELLGQRMTGRDSEFDHDSSKNDPNTNVLEECNKDTFYNQFETNIDSDIEELPNKTSDLPCTSWSSYTPAQLKIPVSTPLKPTTTSTRCNSKLSNKLCDWVTSKSSISELEVKLKLEKHEQQLLYSKEEHELKMLYMQEQHVKDLQIKEEQHAMQMKILNQKMLNLKK